MCFMCEWEGCTLAQIKERLTRVLDAACYAAVLEQLQAARGRVGRRLNKAEVVNCTVGAWLVRFRAGQPLFAHDPPGVEGEWTKHVFEVVNVMRGWDEYDAESKEVSLPPGDGPPEVSSGDRPLGAETKAVVAQRLLRECVDARSVVACFEMSRWCPDEEQAAWLWRAGYGPDEAEDRMGRAQFRLGELFSDGSGGVRACPRTAMRCFMDCMDDPEVDADDAEDEYGILKMKFPALEPAGSVPDPSRPH